MQIHTAKTLFLFTETGKNLAITALHLIYKANRCDARNIEAVFAGRIQNGDCLIDENFQPVTVVRITSQRKLGVFAPLTEENTLVVDGIFASCFANNENEVLQRFFYKGWLAVKSLLPETWWNSREDPEIPVSIVLLAVNKLQNSLLNY